MSDFDQQTLFQHISRREWGGALVAWERNGRRGYQFEDGHLRVFAASHYHLLERIAASLDRVRTLNALLGLPDRKPEEASARTSGGPSLEEQVAYFVAAFPGGFAGEAWQAERRGVAERSRKRHRRPAIERAQKELTTAYLDGCLDGGREKEGLATLAGVLAETDLVPSPHVRRLTDLPPNRARAVLIGLFDLLHAGSSAEVRMVQWVQALTRGTGRKPTWPLATAPLALVYPDEHVCVHRASFVAQAAELGLRPRVAATPSGSDYAPLLAMAERVRARLVALECAPADLLDVHDFMVLTLTAAAVKEMAAPVMA